MLHTNYISDAVPDRTKKEELIYCGIVAGGIYYLVLSLGIYIYVLPL